MVKAVGTDSGTKSMDLFGFDDENEEIFLDRSIPRDEITEDPGIVIEELKKVQDEVGTLDCIIASSGYGIPLKRAEEATEEEINLATFITERDIQRRLKIVGLRELMKKMKEVEDLNVYFSPGVVQLPTVPEHRKANKVDLGTSDKVYTVALAINDQADRLGIDYSSTSLIVVEIGFAYTSAMAAQSGKIVDGMAGTAGFPGYMGLGFMDSELAYALGNTSDDLSKMSIFQGGAAFVSGLNPLKIEISDFVKFGGKGYDLMLESVIKDVASLLPITQPKEVVLSGRFTKIPRFLEDLEQKFDDFFEKINSSVDIVNLKHRGKNCKEAAEGSAIIANGVAGGEYEELIKNMEIKKSSGSIFGHLYLAEEYTNKIAQFEK